MTACQSKCVRDDRWSVWMSDGWMKLSVWMCEGESVWVCDVWLLVSLNMYRMTDG